MQKGFSSNGKALILYKLKRPVRALSVVIITKNEEKNLGRCLSSVRDIADEILVVDSCSTDKTEEIAQQFNARFITHPFQGHVEQKNFALQNATYELILSLDADEAIDPSLQEEIRQIKQGQDKKSYQINRLNNYCGKWIKHGSWYPDRRIRLISKGAASWGGRNPHDKLIPHKGSKVARLKGHILHFTVSNLEEHLNQINYFSSLAAQSKYEARIPYRWWQLAFNPPWRFFKEYIIKLGFLDGFAGLQIAVLSAYSGFLRYAKLRELWKNTTK